jgi:hypothetical protein
MSNGPVKYRIGLGMATLMVGLALFIDLAEMILEWLLVGLVLNIILTGIVISIFLLWFAILGIPITKNWKLLIGMIGMPALEAIPFLDAMGGFFWTMGIVYLVMMVRAEDRGGMGLLGKIALTAATGGAGGAVSATGSTVAKAGAKSVAKNTAKGAVEKAGTRGRDGLKNMAKNKANKMDISTRRSVPQRDASEDEETEE